MSFNFTSKDGLCPECRAFGRKWYIQDRSAGAGCYEYCLMSVSLQPQPVYSFPDLAHVAAWLNDSPEYLEKDSCWVDLLIRRWTRFETSDAALIEKNGVEYRLDKHTSTLTALPMPQRETGWFAQYRECLAAAKEILQKKSGALAEAAG